MSNGTYSLVVNAAIEEATFSGQLHSCLLDNVHLECNGGSLEASFGG